MIKSLRLLPILLLLQCAGLLIHQTVSAQDIYSRNTSADVQHYSFKLTLNDDNDEIIGETVAIVNFKNGITPFSLDLVGKGSTYGMEVSQVLESDKAANFSYKDDKITIIPESGESLMRKYTIKYNGIPERGLVIDTTKFGQRSFFGDNWPNLARHWLACVDHPYDKASVEFRIIAPAYYDVIATGKKQEESYLDGGNKLTRYSEPAPVPMKVITIGVTKFATQLLGIVENTPVTAWVYPENRLEGFSDYGVAVDVLEYFIEKIGPYAYAKLANMQAKTQWGGLENAGTIAYFENSVTGKNQVEGLIAHEIAHQWFGNSATENSWNHIWLSEGFATYFTILYQESVYGNEKRKSELDIDKKQIFDYYMRNPAPIIDNSIKDPMRVLSTNTYQKGGWVLNMLRRRMGDEVFWTGIRKYYDTYKNSNAMTADFRAVMEEVSGDDLKAFFQQWLYTEGHPQISWSWRYDNKKVTIDITQTQDHHTFSFPLEIGISVDGKIITEVVQITDKNKRVELETPVRPGAVVLDPELWLLFEDVSLEN